MYEYTYIYMYVSLHIYITYILYKVYGKKISIDERFPDVTGAIRYEVRNM
jgi:hypothetical protein